MSEVNLGFIIRLWSFYAIVGTIVYAIMAIFEWKLPLYSYKAKEDYLNLKDLSLNYYDPTLMSHRSHQYYVYKTSFSFGLVRWKIRYYDSRGLKAVLIGSPLSKELDKIYKQLIENELT